MTDFFLQPADFVRSADAMSRSYTMGEAWHYTRWLARHHYENFPVVSFLLPAKLHQDFFNVYAFCRWADDLGDELKSPEESLRQLSWWKTELNSMYEGRATHPVYVALKETVERHQLPKEPFADLIRAFVQDQTVTRYESYDQLFGYCQCSANPVGRLVLSLCGYDDAERLRLSDATCTGLQLANFWQDVAVDLAKGRLYLPQEALQRHGCDVKEIAGHHASPAFRSLMREAVEVARGFFREGLPLARTLDRRLGLDVDLFSRGGLQILSKIEDQDYDVLKKRPSISRRERAGLLLRALLRLALPKAA